MQHIVVTDGFKNAEHFSLLTEAGHAVTLAECATPREIIQAAADADAILVGGALINAEVVKGLKKCKVIVRGGVGYDVVDLAAAGEAGIAVCNVPTATTDEVADHTMALTLALARRLPQMDASLRGGHWDMAPLPDTPSFDEMQFVVLGFGNIGRAVLRRARAFKFKLGAFDVRGSHRDFSRLGATRMELDEAIAAADILSLHLPLLPMTEHILNAERLRSMRPGSIVINTGRGGLVETDALVHELQSGHIAAAGLDVFEEEPLPRSHALCKLPNVLLTPHLAAYSNGAMERVARLASEEILRGMRGETLQHCVNRRARGR